MVNIKEIYGGKSGHPEHLILDALSK